MSAANDGMVASSLSGLPFREVETEILCAKGIARHLFSRDEAWRGRDQIGDAVDNGRTRQLDGRWSVDDDLGRGLSLDRLDILIELTRRIDFADALGFDDNPFLRGGRHRRGHSRRVSSGDGHVKGFGT
jgi:hypothetical protein